MISWTRPPNTVQRFFQESIWRTADRKSIALSFDDGPGPLTSRLLDWAKKNGVKLVFFILPESLKKDPGSVKSAAASGHIIGSHFSHHRSYLLDNKQLFQSELLQSVQIIEEIVAKPVKFCRAPYGRIFPWQQQWITELGLRHVFWTLDLKDYQQWASLQAIRQKIRNRMRAGDIVLMHDGRVFQPALMDVLDYIVNDTDFVISGELL